MKLPADNSRYSVCYSILIAVLIFIGCNQAKAPVPYGPVPSENQLRWQEMEYYAFLHFSLNTYTNQSWGYGNEDIGLFNPTELDCRQWARICKEAGMKGIIITAKHHGGFCLWPSQYTEYSVRNAPWKDGTGDVIRELADACKEYGLKLGIYVSPWDRNHSAYGSPGYITYFRNQIKELLTGYGEIFEIWFDGANGGTGYYGGANEERKIDRTCYYDWLPTYEMIRKLQPNIVIWNDGGNRADLRWVGTEAGYVGETNWSLLNASGEVEWSMLHYGLENGDSWVPAEVNTSIRPEWFYHPAEDDRVKKVPVLMDAYYNSIGRNGTLLLNLPIMPNGLIHENDEKAVLDFARAVKEAFATDLTHRASAVASHTRGNSRKFQAARAIDQDKNTYWTTDDSITKASLTLVFDSATTFNRFLVQEYIRLGQRVKAFTLEALVDGNWQELASASTIGYKRILRFPAVTTSQLRFHITDAKSCPVISTIAIYNAPQLLDPPSVIRNKEGELIITPVDAASEVYFTLDGSDPTPGSEKYSGPVPTEGKLEVKAIAYDRDQDKTSPITTESFDLPRTQWKIVGINDEKAVAVIDGDPQTAWYHSSEESMPVDMLIDMGTEQRIIGFKYLPDLTLWDPGIINTYRFYISNDARRWKKVDEGEFSNIKNNPAWQVRRFVAEDARYFRLEALGNTTGTDRVGYAELSILTE